MSDQDSGPNFPQTLQVSNQIEIANRTYSEILMEQIVNDDDFLYQSMIDDDQYSRAKVIPTIANQTIIYRNTIDMKRQQPNIFQRCFGSKKSSNKVTMAEIIDLRQKELFNDYVYETEKDGFLKDVQKYIHKVKVLEPDSQFYILWQVLNSILVVLFFFQIPFIFAYQPLIQENKSNDYQDFETFALNIAICIFIIDIALTFNIAFYKQGYLVSGRKLIAVNYIKTYFFLDLIPLCCLIEYRIFLHKDTQFGITIFLFILKIYEVFKTSKMIQEYLQLEPQKLAKYRLLIVMLTITWLCHLFACVFFFVGRRELCKGDESVSWLSESDLITMHGGYTYLKKHIFELHLYSFYWAVTTMISVGYGDVTPKNAYEVLVTVVTQFISCIVFAYSVNAIWEMINQQNENKQKFQKYVNAIERFMREHNVDRKLKARIEAYLYHLWESEKARDHELEQAMILKLAPALKEELIYQTLGKMLNHNQFFSYFQQDLLIELAQDIQQQYYSQEEVIFQEREEIDDFPVFFLTKGSVEIYLDSDKPIKLHIMKSGIFGIVAFITGYKRTASARCLTYSVIYKLSRTQFLKRLEKYSIEKQKFFEIRHQVLFNNNNVQLKLKCYICESKKHLVINCKKTLYIPEKMPIILETYNLQNQRDHLYQRRVVKQQFKALSHIREVQVNAVAIKKYFQNITFTQNSSDEDIEYSSDVDDYEEEMEDIKKIVEQEKEKAQLRKRGQWVADDDYEMKIDESKDNHSIELSDGQRKSQQLIKHSDEEIKKKSNLTKKKKFQSFVKLEKLRNVRTSSMSSLTPIQEQVKKAVPVKKDKGMSALLPNNYLAQRKKSKLLQQNEIPNCNKSQQIPQQNEKYEKVQSPDRHIYNESKKSELLRKMKFLQIAQPKNKEIQSIIDELKNYIQNSQNLQGSVTKEPGSVLKTEKVDNNIQQMESHSDVDSQFSIDHMANYDAYFQEENPEKVIKKYKKQTKDKIKQRRTTMMRQFV
ncbi:unnamed protein product (macronuclear) [Paramecium tetraurelia]|uniref:Cyclic nucleotide-binding domain-containing protein n=1 Tax=Paramecium tetraurelia TaxID=5888 RepID=A0BYZ8_PARTE|nr:uncharacterized protein GSPATT00033618001 [Paramecium tetraurelia]CAK63765.1 unnamed protein product [Paramecium tetraurelia]|eukprot:XP_001431163.1 hypothetical protein (macronuclear) [Paramecium tetraurelia strain d4-2]